MASKGGLDISNDEGLSIGDVPPAYGDDAGQSVDDAGVEAFSALNLGGGLEKPDADTCLAHLRLLGAFYSLKNEIGYRDGLWDIWDSRAVSKSADDAHRNAADVLVKLREKRWAVYVARAVNRYEAWWASFVPDMLTEKDMVDPDESRATRYTGFTKAEPMIWASQSLPPLDVLLVWHAHQLNPRLYLEDCLRYGHGPLWASGMPWALLNNAIGTHSQYTTSEDCKANWHQRTGRSWANEEDSQLMELKCPACSTNNTIPWTTCGLPEDYKGIRRPGIVGEGYGDGQLSHVCPSCGTKITHDLLRVSKFQADVKKLVTDDLAMPGTILNLKTGIPKQLNANDKDDSEQLFPSRLVRRGLLVEVASMVKPGSSDEPSMRSVRDVIESITGKFAEPSKLRHVEDKQGIKKVMDVKLQLTARRQTRQMMSRYWENASPFSINLCGCVLRQGLFTSKMKKLGWLNPTTNRDLMERLLVRYGRFFEIMGQFPEEAAVPTVDVDLAWHTHQLSPKSYFDFAVAKTKVFTDHNDRVDEEKLSVAFEWTSKIYQEKYGEVYSECRCWYCETTRVMHLSSVRKMFTVTKEEKLLENWHSSGESQKAPMPPEAESAHISAHPAVQTIETTARRAHTRPLRLNFRNRLEESHSKARKRANKTFKANAGKRMGPRGEDKVDFWGTVVDVASPFASATAATTTAAIYAAPPGTVNTGGGSDGACASGTCNGSAGCGSGTVGMCSAGCVGSGINGTYSGCAGGQ